MKVGDMIKFSQAHWEKPGLDYCADWLGIIVEKTMDHEYRLATVSVLWPHGGAVTDYPSSWWNKLPYEPFEVISNV